jgi:capsular polysaccharide biosynthesis protein
LVLVTDAVWHLGGAFSLVSLSGQPSTYTSVSRISIGNTIQDTNQASAIGALQPALQPILQNYVELVLGSVQEKTLETLGLTAGSIDLEEVVSTRIVPNTTLLEISVTYTDPVLAADIANTLAEELIMASPSYLTDEQKLQLETARTQVEVLTAVLSGLQAQLNDLNGKIEVATRADDAPDEQLSKSFDLALGSTGHSRGRKTVAHHSKG